MSAATLNSQRDAAQPLGQRIQRDAYCK